MRETNRETILIVEDDAGVALLEGRQLQRAGYQVVTAATADEALRQVQKTDVDLILLDYRLPGDVDGLDLFGQVRAAGYDLPVILVTAFSNEATVIRALRAGVRDFVTKSVEYLDYIPEAVDRVLRQVRTEHQLVESEVRFRTMADNAPVFIWLKDPAGECVFVNQSWLDFTGNSREQSLGGGWTASIHPEDSQRCLTVYRSAFEARKPFTMEYRARRRDGEYCWILDTGAPRFLPDGSFAGYIGSAINITQRKQAEAALQASEAQYRSIVETTSEGIWRIDASGRTTYANQRLAEMLGLTAERVLGRSFFDFLFEEDRAAAEAAWQRRREQAKEQVETRLRRTDGSAFWALVNWTPLWKPNGDFDGSLGMLTDVSDRRMAAERIREQAALLDKATDAIFVQDLRGRILFWNHSAETLYGWPAAQALGRVAAELIVAAAPPKLEDVAAAAIAKGEWNGELRQQTNDGKEIVVASRWTLVPNDQGKPKAMLVINTDITETKRLSAHLLHAQRMEAIGLLAGGVAHDFNNLLTVINGYSEMLLRNPASAQPSPEMIREIRSAGERAASLTRQLLAFSRKQILAAVVLDLNTLVREIEKMLRRLIGEDISLTAVLDPALGRVKADPAQIEQVLINLALNARDAMPRGGRLTIETRSLVLDEAFVQKNPGAVPGRYVLLAVTDSGTGMDEDTKAHLFEPFFTTKEVGKGTGLGLATVYGIIKQSGGYISVTSEPGQGSAFKIYLPRCDEPLRTTKSALGLVKVPKGTETVLLAEDEDGVRAIACLALRSNGYTVLEAHHGQEALQICKGYSGPIDLLVTDVVMPTMSGRDLADQIAALRPKTRVLFLSGYTDDAIVRHGVLETGMAFLSKPFTPSSLARKVREVLDEGLEAAAK